MSAARRRPAQSGTKAARAPAQRPEVRIVGIGASAGGLEAFTKLLRALPPDTGRAFVLVQHLSPNRESVLADILSRATTMPVMEATEGIRVRRNHVYVIPPDRSMEHEQGCLRLTPRDEAELHHPVDFFFRSLAASQGQNAIGVVLSGTASDGTIGLKAIKAAGGITFAQDRTAHHPGMPESAVESGIVDFVLPPESIAAEITRIAKRPPGAKRPTTRDAGAEARAIGLVKDRLAPILHNLHAAIGVDFSQYKTSTLQRRVARRMTLHKEPDFEAYARIVKADAKEADALYRDILINVTRFFRDPDVFETLRKKFLPALLKGRRLEDPLRIWVIGCATGEEAYSLGMILTEAVEAVKEQATFQILATDLNEAAIAQARAGVYSKEKMRGVSAKRANRFFTEKAGVFRVRKELREMCLFSRHNVLTDPPLSRMDIVSCRNLLIYLEPALQKSIIPVLHYALKPEGLLVLGASETVGQLHRLFSAEASKQKIYRKIPGSERVPLLPRGRAPTTAQSSALRSGMTAVAVHSSPVVGADAHGQTVQLLASFAPPAVLVNDALEILEFHGDTEAFLAPARGKANHSLLKMARDGLQVPLRVLLHRVKKANLPAREEVARFRSGKGFLRVNLRALPVAGGVAGERSYLVIFEKAAAPQPAVTSGRARGGKTQRASRAQESAAAKIERLEHELASDHGYLQALIEQYEAANEELQASNEEAQSTNEEFQSVNEELETSKEEIQSSNEELTTINDELTQRNLELAQLSADLTNLIQSVQVAIVIVTLDLRIRRYSPIAEKILNIRASDLGRPLTDIRMNLVHSDLGPLLIEVISTRTAQDQEVEAQNGRWYSLRIQPYYSDGTRIDGAVLSMIDITAIRSAREYAESIVATVREPLLVLDDQLRIRSASRSFYETFGVQRENTEGLLLYDLGNGEWNLPELRRLLGEVLSVGMAVNDFELEHEFKGLGHRTLLVNARRLADPIKGQQFILLSIEDITLRKHQAAELERRNEELAANDTAKNHFLAVLSHELRSPLNVIRLWSQILQSPGRSEGTLRQGLAIIARSSKTQARLVDDLLDVHRISSGKLRLDLAEVNLADILRPVLDAMEAAAQQKQIRLIRDIDLAPAFLLCDTVRLQQVFGNVIENAIKFTPEGGEVRVVLQSGAARAEVSVSDTGVGLDPAEIPRIFEGFQPVDPLTSRSHGGLGLGLSIAKQLVVLHRGTVTAESAGKGKGLTVRVSLPLLTRPRAAIDPLLIAKGLHHGIAQPLRGISVLVVDDELDAREALRLVLEEAGAEATVVSSADEALAALRRMLPDIILSDIGMPGRDGYELMRAVRELPADQGGRVAGVAITAYAALEDRELALSSGFQEHLPKPLDPAKLIATIALLLELPTASPPPPPPVASK